MNGLRSLPLGSLGSVACAALLFGCPACKRSKAPQAPADPAPQATAPAPAPAQAPAAMSVKAPDAAEPPRERKRPALPPAQPCLGDAADPLLADLLDQAARQFERGRWADALECARQASRLDQGNVAAHHFRGAAMAELGLLDEARTAYARALALDPDDPEVLRSASDLYVRRLGGRDDLELALAYVRRALPRAEKGKDKLLLKELHLLASMAFDDLGRPLSALEESAHAVELDPKDREARREKGVALFELSRFDQARVELAALAAEEPDAWAEHYLGLIAERANDEAGAQLHFARAQQLDPEAFRPVSPPKSELFAQMIREESVHLPPEVLRGLQKTEVQVQDLPEVADLVATDPPLSPGILGLFRPPSGGSPGDKKPAIILYRRNLARAARSEEELRREVRDTLLHEVGHLNGEDDEQLRDRGL